MFQFYLFFFFCPSRYLDEESPVRTVGDSASYRTVLTFSIKFFFSSLSFCIQFLQIENFVTDCSWNWMGLPDLSQVSNGEILSVTFFSQYNINHGLIKSICNKKPRSTSPKFKLGAVKHYSFSQCLQVFMLSYSLDMKGWPLILSQIINSESFVYLVFRVYCSSCVVGWRGHMGQLLP